MRAALTGLLVVSIAACAPRTEVRLQQLYESATAQLWRGELTDASSGAREGRTLADREKASDWAWRFKLLAAEIHLVSRDLPAAAALLKESEPTGDWVSAKHHYLQGQLALLRGQAAEATAILDEADRFAQRASAPGVRLDIGAMKGQALLGLR